ncbi:MAG TPA: DNA-formamidopyrimidine glycosylase family protein [Bacteroidota bacterium]|nr:DNA-formamidopyrimidine glycosylase family protein [Bacteroidota bacterium]
MPELPDLLYIKSRLAGATAGRSITAVEVRQPVLLRNMLDEPLEGALRGRSFNAVDCHGPFLRLGLSGDVDMVTNLMLAGRFQHQKKGEKPEGHLCVAWVLDDGSALRLCDEKKMAKLYVCRRADTDSIPRYGSQGVDILSPEFTPEKFRALVRANSRRQVRVMINDHTVLSAIGNAYADEVLFEARIHPKTFSGRLSEEETGRLFEAIRNVMAWGTHMVEQAARPIHVKVREHMKVRNRKGEPCPRCGTTIRREGVRGHDTFFCPVCQPASRKLFIDWRNTGTPPVAP